MKLVKVVLETETISIVLIAGLNVHISLCYKSCGIFVSFLLFTSPSLHNVHILSVKVLFYTIYTIYVLNSIFLMLCLHYNSVAKLALRKALA